MGPSLHMTGVLIQRPPCKEERHKEARKGSPPRFQREHIPPALDADFQNRETMRFCCPQTPSLWGLVVAAPANAHTRFGFHPLELGHPGPAAARAGALCAPPPEPRPLVAGLTCASKASCVWVCPAGGWVRPSPARSYDLKAQHSGEMNTPV